MYNIYLIFTSANPKDISLKKKFENKVEYRLAKEFKNLIESIKISYGHIPDITILTDFDINFLKSIDEYFSSESIKYINVQDIMPADVVDFLKDENNENKPGLPYINKCYLDSINDKGLLIDLDGIVFPGFFEIIDQNKIFIANQKINLNPAAQQLTRKITVDKIWKYLNLTNMQQKLKWTSLAVVYWNNLPKNFCKTVRDITRKVYEKYPFYIDEIGYTAACASYNLEQKLLNYAVSRRFVTGQDNVKIIHSHIFSEWFGKQQNKKDIIYNELWKSKIKELL